MNASHTFGGPRLEADTIGSAFGVQIPYVVDTDFDGFIGMRLSEHTLHTWDVEVALDPQATLGDDGTELVVDRVEMIARFTGKPSGTVHDVRVRTSNPTRDFTIALGAESVSLTPGASSGACLLYTSPSPRD